MKLYLARHGECEGNALRLFFGHTDYPLTQRGHEHTKQLFAKFTDISVSACYTSCLSRSYLTAEACVKQKNISVCKLPAFNEQYIGALEGVTYEQAIKQYPDAVENMLADWTMFPPPHGESFEAVSARVLKALQAVMSEDEDARLSFLTTGRFPSLRRTFWGCRPTNAGFFISTTERMRCFRRKKVAHVYAVSTNKLQAKSAVFAALLLIINLYAVLGLPMKNSASVPGPQCEPMTAPTMEMLTGTFG